MLPGVLERFPAKSLANHSGYCFAGWANAPPNAYNAAFVGLTYAHTTLTQTHRTLT